MKKRRAVCGLAAFTLLTLAIQPAEAAGFHQYSAGSDTSQGAGYSGVSVYRQDVNLTNANPCIYQSQWVGLSSGSWVELGTGWGSSCFAGIGNGYWYFGYGVVSGGVQNFYVTGTRQANPNQSHVFALYRAGSIYVGYVDSTEIGRVPWAQWFTRVVAGLESYMNLAVITPHNYDTLRYSHLAGPWQFWADQDAINLQSPQMCGKWSLPTRWRGGQNAIC